MDYRVLLFKYMRFVDALEATTFLSYAGEIDFTHEEYRTLSEMAESVAKENE